MDIGSLTGQIALEDQLSGHLTTITAHVRRFADNFSTSMAASVIGVGAVTAAITGAAISIVNLGEKGSIILGVEESFNRLASAAGSTGEALLRGLNEGVKSTLDSMTLMQSTNRLLSSGIKLTEKDMELMGATAREMGKATGTDAAGGLNTLSQALLTGNVRSLKRFGINIDLVKSETEFARSIGTTRDQLSEVGRTEARRIAMLEGMRTKLDTLGTSEVSFKEKVMQSRVAVSNWFDSLAKGVASSASVSKAFDAIRDSIVATFGGTSQTLLQTLLGWVDKFADGVARIGPTVIQVIGNIKTKIVEIWNEIVSFNDRWQITNNIIAGAKFAWGLLEKAFYLVKAAVVAVIQAWSSMPEWLQRITKTALEGSVALAAYSVAIGAVSTPFRALVGTVDLAINIFGNLTGGIMASMAVWPNLTRAYNLSTAALVRHTTAVRLSNAGHVVETFLLKSVYLARVDLAIITGALSSAYTTLTARILMNSTVLRAHAIYVTVVKNAKAAWAIVTALVSTAYTGLLTRLGLTTVAMRASAVATGLTTIAMESLGFVILGIQAIPLVAALVGIAFGMKKIWDAWDGLSNRTKGQSIIGYLHNTRDYDNWARQFINFVSQSVAGIDLLVNKVEEARSRLKKGGAVHGQGPFDSQYVIDPKALAVGSAELQAARALRKKEEDRAAGRGLIDDPDSFVKSSTAAEDFLKKVRDQAKAYAEAGQGALVFARAFKELTPAQRENYDVQQMLVPEIDKLHAAYQPLTAEMVRVRNAATAYRLELLQGDETILKNSELTSNQIERLKKLGLTEADIAFQFGVTVEALGRRNAAMLEARKITDDLVAAQDALIEQRAAVGGRRFESEAGGQLQDITAQFEARLIGARDFATQRIEIESQIAADQLRIQEDALTRSEAIELRNLEQRISRGELANATETQLQQMRTNIYEKFSLLRTDLEQKEADRRRAIQSGGLSAIRAMQEEYNQLVKQGTVSRLQIQENEIDEWARQTVAAYKGTGKQVEEFTALVSRLSRLRKDRLRVDQQAIDNYFDNSLREQANRARATYRFVADQVEIFGDKAVKHFKRVADEAERHAKFVESGWAKAFEVIGTAADILNEIPTKWAKIGSEALRSAQNIQEAYLKGGVVGAVIQAVQEGVKWIAKLVIASREGRNAVKDFARSFGDLGTGNIFAGLSEKLSTMGPLGREMWILLTQGTPAGNAELAAANIAKVQAAIESFDNDLQRYNLTWKNLVNGQKAGTAAGLALEASYWRLIRAGYKQSDVLEGMSEDLNQYIVDSVRAGTLIPAAMRPIIETLIRTGKLTDAAARAILGLADTGVPALADIKDAADRYGITLDELGSKVKQLEITELANQYVADWTLLTSVTDDWGVIFDRMGPKVQDLVTDAIRYGSELPAAMRPMIQAWIEAGRLVDENGESLTDLSRLTFAADLSAMFETLITKLDELIDTITTGVGGALDDLGRRIVRPRIEPEIVMPGMPAPGGDGGTAVYRASGGKVNAGQSFPGAPRGADTIPVWMAPQERVLTESQNRDYESRSADTQTIEIHIGDAVTKHVLKKGGPRLLKLVGAG